MKPRVIHSYKILAVAITAGVGCTTPDPPRPDPKPATETTPSPVASAPAPSPVTPASGQAARAAAGPEHAPPPPDDKADPKLIELRARLDLAGRDTALANEKTFRPLCDAEGYPLVGNLMRKSPTQPFGPTAFCAEVRSKKRS